MKTEEKLAYILAELQKGRDREEVAIEAGYKNYRTMDIFLRRQGYYWDKTTRLYLTEEQKQLNQVPELAPNIVGKAGEVIRLFSKGLEPKEIAKKAGFKDHKELAVYMGAKNYYWNDDVGNYQLPKQEVAEEEADVEAEEVEESLVQNAVPTSSGVPLHYGKYDAMLEFLLANESKIRQLLGAEEQNELGQIPRYAVPGIPITKSIYMKNYLAQLVTDFSKEKNVKQNDIVEAALIEYFKKYGYKKEVEKLLNS